MPPVTLASSEKARAVLGILHEARSNDLERAAALGLVVATS